MRGPSGGSALKYRQLADVLRRDIVASVWPPGSKLPTDEELRAETGLALSTIRRAYDLLVREGFVVRQQGAGTFVLDRGAGRGVRGLTIGAIVPVTQLYYGKIMHGIESELNAAGVGIRFAAHDYDVATEGGRIADLLHAGIDGLILVPAGFSHEVGSDQLTMITELPVPTVLLERTPPSDDPGHAIEYVCSDHAGGAADGIKHLARLGHHKIALATRMDAPTRTGVERGYRHAVSALDIDGVEISYPNAAWPSHAGDALAEIMRARCTAALVFGDREATMLLDAARKLGIDVPHDLALVSYDDEFADIAPVPLTAVSPAKHRLGELAGRTMVQRLQEGNSGAIHQVKLRPRLVVRRSCGADG